MSGRSPLSAAQPQSEAEQLRDELDRTRVQLARVQKEAVVALSRAHRDSEEALRAAFEKEAAAEKASGTAAASKEADPSRR